MEQLLTSVKQRDIFIVPFPFSNHQEKKRRPALVLSSASFNHSSDDVIVCAITSNNDKHLYGVRVTSADLEEGFFPRESIIKPENMVYLEKILLLKKVGTLRKENFEKVLSKIHDLFW